MERTNTTSGLKGCNHYTEPHTILVHRKVLPYHGESASLGVELLLKIWNIAVTHFQYVLFL